MSAQHESPQIALARVDGLLNKVFAIAVVLLTVDVAQNAFRQIQYLNPLWFWSTFSALIISVFGLVISSFFVGKARYWYRALVIVVLFTLLTWAFQMQHSEVLPREFKPWVWWALGYAVVAAAGGWKRLWAIIALVVGPAIWLIVATSSSGGHSSFLTAIQDSLYTFFFSAAITLLVLELRR
jgi:MFS superfamily sulfate permease-like transporter